MRAWMFFVTLIFALLGMYYAGRNATVAAFPERKWVPATKSEEEKRVIRGRTPMETASKFLESSKLEIPEHYELRPEVTRTPLGPLVTYEVYQDGIPILGMRIELRMNRDMELVESDLEYRALPKADTDPRLSPEEVAEAARSRYQFVVDPAYGQHVGKVLVARSETEAPELAYVIPMNCGRLGSCQAVLRANDGQLLARSYSRGEF